MAEAAFDLLLYVKTIFRQKISPCFNHRPFVLLSGTEAAVHKQALPFSVTPFL